MKYDTTNNLQREYDKVNSQNKHSHRWFDKETLRFFRSKVAETCFVSDDGERWYFVSSERAPEATKRLYTVRFFNHVSGQIGTVGAFQQYSYAVPAEKEAKRLAMMTREQWEASL